MPLISIIIPVYQVEKYISRCIDSILNQTFTDFEILAVDDGTNDSSGIIMDNYAKKDSRIKVFHTANHGQASARNYALNWMYKYSNSEFIAFIDSDDWVHPRYLELLLDALRKYDVNISQCLYVHTAEELRSEDINAETLVVTPEEQYLKWYNSLCWSKLYRRKCFENLRFPENVIYEDVAISYKLIFEQSYIAVVNAPLYYYFTRPDSTVNSYWTPKHYNRVNVWEAQRIYFSEFAGSELMANVMDRYLSVLCSQLSQIKQSPAIDEKIRREYTVKVKGLIRKYIRMYHKILSPVKNRYLEAAYPIVMRGYWISKGLLHSIKKRLG